MPTCGAAANALPTPRSILVQEPAGKRNSASYWNCHDVLVIGELSPVDSPGAILDAFHVVTLYENTTIAVYRVQVCAQGSGAGVCGTRWLNVHAPLSQPGGMSSTRRWHARLDIDSLSRARHMTLATHTVRRGIDRQAWARRGVAQAMG